MAGIVRYRPTWGWGLMDLRNEIDRMFRNFFETSEVSDYYWSPSVDMVEEDDKLVVTAELPGVNKKDVKISMQDNVLTIEGEKTMAAEYKEDKYCRRERSYGKFSRSFTLPVKVDADKIEATYDAGILTIKLPKAEEAKPKQIVIK